MPQDTNLDKPNPWIQMIGWGVSLLGLFLLGSCVIGSLSHARDWDVLQRQDPRFFVAVGAITFFAITVPLVVLFWVVVGIGYAIMYVTRAVTACVGFYERLTTGRSVCESSKPDGSSREYTIAEIDASLTESFDRTGSR